MQNYVIIGLLTALLFLGWRYHEVSSDFADAQNSLAAAQAVNESNRIAFERLERRAKITDEMVAGWNEDRTTFAGVRNDIRRTIKESMRDEIFNAWAVVAVPPDAWRMLGKAPDPHGNGGFGPAFGPAGGLPGNAGSGVGK